MLLIINQFGCVVSFPARVRASRLTSASAPAFASAPGSSDPQLIQKPKHQGPANDVLFDKRVVKLLLDPPAPFVERNFLCLRLGVQLLVVVVAKDFDQFVLLRVW